MSIQVKAIPLLLLSLLAAACAGPRSSGLFGPPAWTRKRPVSKDHYIGIGTANKAEAGAACAQAAKGKALADLSSEIFVTVSSEMVDKFSEKSGLSETEVLSDIRSATRNELEAYDAVDSWESDAECWVYYRLAKADYERTRLKRKEERSRLALDLWEKGLKREAEGNVPGALALYVQALSQVQFYLGEGAEVQRDGKPLLLTNEIYSSLQSLLGSLRLAAERDRFKVVSGRNLALDLGIKALVRRPGGQEEPVAGLPVSCSFVRGGGSVSRGAQTDASGSAACRLTRVESTDKVQVLLARPELARMAAGESSVLLQETLKRLSRSAARFEFEVSGRPTYLSAKETNMGSPVEVPQLVPALSEALTGLGLSLVGSASKADLVIELVAAARKVSEFHGMCVAHLDLSLEAKDRTEGTELYKASLQNLKGMQFDCRRAGLKAYEGAMPTFKNETLPALGDSLKR